MLSGVFAQVSQVAFDQSQVVGVFVLPRAKELDVPVNERGVLRCPAGRR